MLPPINCVKTAVKLLLKHQHNSQVRWRARINGIKTKLGVLRIETRGNDRVPYMGDPQVRWMVNRKSPKKKDENWGYPVVPIVLGTPIWIYPPVN
jgi:hypothetical protein